MGIILLFAIIGLYIFIVLFDITKNKKILKTVTKPYRGTRSERELVLKLLKHGIPEQTIFHDLYVEKSNGKYSQIDLVVATKVGIIVFEVKNYSGWVFGKGYQNQWTQVLAYGKEKYRFYNPIMQNNWHITALKNKLKRFGKIPFYSVIVFYGDCELRDVSFIPDGTYLTYPKRVIDVINTIVNENEPAVYFDKHAVVNVLKKAVENGDDMEIQNKHIQNLKDMLGKDRIFE